MRPAAFRRGMMVKLRLEEETGLSSKPDSFRSAATQARGSSLSMRTPRFTSARFWLRMGMRSATVPRVARSTRSSHMLGRPKRLPTACTTFRATPAPAKIELGLSPHLGSTTGTPCGTRSEGS